MMYQLQVGTLLLGTSVLGTEAPLWKSTGSKHGEPGPVERFIRTKMGFRGEAHLNKKYSRQADHVQCSDCSNLEAPKKTYLVMKYDDQWREIGWGEIEFLCLKCLLLRADRVQELVTPEERQCFSDVKSLKKTSRLSDLRQTAEVGKADKRFHEVCRRAGHRARQYVHEYPKAQPGDLMKIKLKCDLTAAEVQIAYIWAKICERSKPDARWFDPIHVRLKAEAREIAEKVGVFTLYPKKCPDCGVQQTKKCVSDENFTCSICGNEDNSMYKCSEHGFFCSDCSPVTEEEWLEKKRQKEKEKERLERERKEREQRERLEEEKRKEREKKRKEKEDPDKKTERSCLTCAAMLFVCVTFLAWLQRNTSENRQFGVHEHSSSGWVWILPTILLFIGAVFGLCQTGVLDTTKVNQLGTSLANLAGTMKTSLLSLAGTGQDSPKSDQDNNPTRPKLKRKKREKTEDQSVWFWIAIIVLLALSIPAGAGCAMVLYNFRRNDVLDEDVDLEAQAS